MQKAAQLSVKRRQRLNLMKQDVGTHILKIRKLAKTAQPYDFNQLALDNLELHKKVKQRIFCLLGRDEKAVLELIRVNCPNEEQCDGIIF